MNTKEKAEGVLFGMAFGDALAAPTEFIRDVDEIEKRFGPGGPKEPTGNPARVTDDTQMALAVGEALLSAELPAPIGQIDPALRVAFIEPALREAFVTWMDSPDNNRAPGMTCMSACDRLKRGLPWIKATVLGSKGCGANMRVAPVALLPDTNAETRAQLAQLQAALTHGHPTALAASDLTAYAIYDLAQIGYPEGLPERLRAYALSQRSIYHEDWLGNLWEETNHPSPTAYIERGWDECIEVLDRLDTALLTPDRETDPSWQTGAGWIAEDAFATGLLCFLLFPDDPVAALRRAAVTSGDSDSIACLTGAFAGAYHGISAWPDKWRRRIEYRDRLQHLADAWS